MQPTDPARLAALTAELTAETRATTTLEKWLAGELAYAAWELERVRAVAPDHPDAEARCNAAYNRASRNWNRARKALANRQQARINHATLLTEPQRKVAAVAPLANPAAVPATDRHFPGERLY